MLYWFHCDLLVRLCVRVDVCLTAAAAAAAAAVVVKVIHMTKMSKDLQ